MVVDELSRRHAMVFVMEARILGLRFIKELYKEGQHFDPIFFSRKVV